MVRADVLPGSSGFQRLESEWRELVRDSDTATPFQTFAWNETYFKHYAAKKRVEIVTVRDGNDLVGVAPIVHCSGAWQTIRPLGVGPSDYLHPLARTGYEQDVALVLRHFIQDLPHVDLIDWHQVRETRDLARGQSVVPQTSCLVVDLPTTYEAFIAAQGKNLRYDLRKAFKPPFTTGEASIVEVGPEGFELFVDMHKQRWRKRGLPGAFVGRALRFHREWVHRCAEEGMLRFSSLLLGGETVASLYAMKLGKATYYYQAGVLVQPGSLSPGLMLLGHTARRAIDEGCQVFDFMRGDEKYKQRWKPHRVYENVRIIQPLTAAGRAGARFNTWGGKVEGRVRARLEGKGLL